MDFTMSESGTYLFIMRLAFGASFVSNDSCTARLQDDVGYFGMSLHVNTGRFRRRDVGDPHNKHANEISYHHRQHIRIRRHPRTHKPRIPVAQRLKIKE